MKSRSSVGTPLGQRRHWVAKRARPSSPFPSYDTPRRTRPRRLQTASFQSRCEALGAFFEPQLAALDVVFTHNVATMPFDLPLTAVLWQAADDVAATRFITWVHDLAVANSDYTIPEAGALPWDLLRRAHPHMEYVAVSELRRGQFIELADASRVRCAVVPNGVDLAGQLGLSPQVAALVNRRGLFEKDLVLLHPTRLLRRKNVETSLRVTAALRNRGWDAVLLVTGAEDSHNPDSTEEYAEASASASRQQLNPRSRRLVPGRRTRHRPGNSKQPLSRGGCALPPEPRRRLRPSHVRSGPAADSSLLHRSRTDKSPSGRDSFSSSGASQ